MKNSTLDDIVFEHRNKAYGAYVFRKNYKNVLTKSLVLGCSTILLLTMAAFSYLSKNGNRIETLPPDKIILVNLPNLIVKPKKVKSLKPIQEQAIVKQTQNVNVEPVKNDQVEVEKLATNDELMSQKTGLINVEGPEVLGDEIINIPSGTGEVLIPLSPTPPVDPPVDDNSIKDFVEIAPMFNGGSEALNKFLSSNLNYPSQAARAGVTGRVIVQFVVEKDGSIGNVKVLKGINFGCDEEAVRVISKMPKWKPGIQNGSKVRVYHTLPIYFRLDN